MGSDTVLEISDGDDPDFTNFLMEITSNEVEPVLPIEEDFVRYSRPKKKRGRSGKRKEGPILMWEVLEQENESWIDANETKDADMDILDEEVPEIAEPPQDLLMPLLRYQKEWLAWALKQEESTIRGGILADEMGMGKTIQAIALVLAKRAIRQSTWRHGDPNPSPSTSTVLPETKGTLVICPVVAVRQWVNEIGRFTPTGSTKVLVYHGANRKKSSDEFAEYDFVLTTYSIIEAEYRKNVMPPKEKCVFCGKWFHSRKMSVHLKYFCGPDAVRTAKQSKQVKKKKESGLKPSKEKMKSSGLGSVTDQDWESIEGAGKKANKQYKQEKEPMENPTSRNSVLHSVKWERIILDEAHYIKDRRSSTAKAVLALESSYKWALSGTPLQNRVGELYSLVRFLQITPYSYYFCRDCDCKSLDYSSTSECQNCVHKSMRHFCWWNRYISKPIQASGDLDEGRSRTRAMILLKHKLLKSIVLRRTKKGRAADLALPPTIVHLRRDSFDIKEEDYYNSLYNESQLQFNTYVEAGTLLNNYAHIFDLLTRLRQAVDHPYLVVYSQAALLKNGGTGDPYNGEKVCGICHETAEDSVVTSCRHIFCKACLIDFSSSLEEASCPSCSKSLTVDFTSKLNQGDQNSKTTVTGFKRSSILNRICLEDFQTSTKIEALREEIRCMLERDGSAKGIVFSQFTSFLDLINYSLQKSGINCVQLVGSMTMEARDSAIRKFIDDPDCRIFLMSLKAGGVALNLTVASYVFLMDPWWNPAVERQAQDRIHRIGQYKPIRVIRFIIEDSIEERILKLQEKKELVFEGTIGGSSEALGKLTEADLRFLFNK
ncbi:DNA repair protein RAD16-like isoform X1 [Telopea speciosissima]|uniref:DNA repair protein RAD16-like isoform X1 n=1 Tax=Telopea speciosissima TaxID=54955 RepID=UPI001CC67DC7|nr:DNA repair protein RAD16-like isoform X1 [Telopea speciosissima]